MPDKKLFCSSPWLHIKIAYSGRYLPCRWMSVIDQDWEKLNMRDMSLLQYFSSDQMNQVRTDLLTDKKIISCASCQYEDSFNKTSGRVRQLYRSKLDNMDTFDEVFTESPHYDMFKYSKENNGASQGHPYDLQISLTNTCNNACIMCYPQYSSRLYQDYQKLSKTTPELFTLPVLPTFWADDPVLLEQFIQSLKELPSIDYLHLLGGETLFLESFYTICEALIDAGMADKIFLGTTTNLTLYSDRLENLVTEFSRFHIGLSIESVNPLNDYIRYPSKITNVLENLDKFLTLYERYPDKIHLSLRITPNFFSIFYIDEVIQYMCDHNITGESCDILMYPKCLRIELLPDDLRLQAIEKLKQVVQKNSLERGAVVDARNPSLVRQVIAAVAYSYIDFLEAMQTPDDVETHRFDLIKFISSFETIRHNSILDHAPEYENFLIQYGYTREKP